MNYYKMKQGKKKTGGKYNKRRKKKKYELPGQKRIVRLAEQEKRKSKRTRGGNKKSFLLKSKYINVNEEGKKKSKKLKIKNVVKTPSNRFLARQNIITKGTILETPEGMVKVTNRPSQEGIVNGVFVKEKE
ncbi:30S ribosomal protein S8e [Candidatus Pacearchaeota archaeon]|nr:30S ribosomal protein S8e [Candidatus Pacearchaeota archaeon]